MTRMTHSKNRYQSMLHTYLERREKLRERYQFVGNHAKLPGYSQAVARMAVKINTIRKRLRAIEAREQQLKQINAHLVDFLGVGVRGAVGNTDKQVIMARRLFYKYSIEAGFQGSVVSRFVGAVDLSTSTRNRLDFTRSFRHNPYNQQMWHRFRAYMKEHYEKKDPVALPVRLAAAV